MYKNTSSMVLFTFIILWSSHNAYGEKITLELNANSNDVEVKADYQFPAYEALAGIGGGLTLSSDKYSLGYLQFFVKDEVFMPALTLGLGLKGAYGEVEIHNYKFDLGAVGFVLLGEYDLRQIYEKIPLCLYTDIYFAPSPLCFSETENYSGINLGIRAYIVRQASAVLGYRYLHTEFESAPVEKNASFDAFFIGLQLTF